MEENDRLKVALSVIVPIHNEEDNIPMLYDRLRISVCKITNSYEFIFVNDGSSDNSLREIVKLSLIDSRVLYINFSRNFGHQIAVTAGLDSCKGDAVVIIDGDLQDPPELIPKLYDKLKEGFEVVYAKRIDREGEGFLKKVSAKLFYRILNGMTSIDIPVDTGDYRIIDKKIVDYLKKMPEQNKFLRGQIAWLGFKQSELLFNRSKRKYGKTSYSIRKMFKFALDGITSFSDKPLLLVSRFGFLIAGLSILIILYAIFSNFVLNKVITGWTSLIISSMFIGGVQLISIGVIGEYISRINKNVQKRPLYIIDDTNMVRDK